MQLSELKQWVDDAIERAGEFEESPDEIGVTLQIDFEDGSSVWADSEVELHYDNNTQASGCVLVAIHNPKR